MMTDLNITVDYWKDGFWESWMDQMHASPCSFHAYCDHVPNLTSDILIAGSPYVVPFTLSPNCEWYEEGGCTLIGHSSADCSLWGDLDWYLKGPEWRCQFTATVDGSYDLTVSAQLDLRLGFYLDECSSAVVGEYYGAATKPATNLGPYGSQRAACLGINTWLHNNTDWVWPTWNIGTPPVYYTQWEADIE